MPVSRNADLRGRLSAAPRAAQAARIVTLSPSVVLGFAGLTSLLFVPLLGSLAVLVFLAATVGLMALSPRHAVQSLGAERLFLLLGAWCVISFLWSDYASLTLRHAIQLALTLAFAILLAYRVTPGAFVKIATSSYLVAGLASLANGRTRADGGGYLGIFNSKNALAGAAGLLMIAGLSLLADRSLSLRWRAAGAVAFATGGLLVAMAQSLGTVVAIMAVGGFFLLLLGLRRLPPLTRLLAAVLGLLSFGLIVLLVAAYADALGQMMLDTTGKDITLTGRTDLWAVALQEIAARPLLGAGFQAVWVVSNPLAEALWAQFGVASGSGFNFHNTLLNNAVEIGLIGAAMQAVLLFGAVPALLLWTMRSRRAGPLFLALVLGRQLVLMNVEVTFFTQFDPATVLTVTAIAFAHRYQRETRLSARQAAAALLRRSPAPQNPAASLAAHR